MKRPIPDEAILGLLKDSPSHGYDLLERFRSQDQLGWMWHLSTSQLYAVLKRLEKRGAICGKEISPPDAPVKVVYAVTDKGEAIFENWLFDPEPSASIHRIRVIFLSRLYLAKLLSKDITKIIQNQRRVCEKQMKTFMADQRLAGSPFEKLALSFIIGQLQSALRWLDQCEDALSFENNINKD